MEKENITKEESKILIKQFETEIYVFNIMKKAYTNPTEDMVNYWNKNIKRLEGMIKALKEDL